MKFTRFAAAAALSGVSLAQFDLGTFNTPYGPAPKGCAPYELIIARGTSEPGSFGSIVGDPIVRNVKWSLPSARGYAVQYPASAGEGTVETGVKDILQRLTGKDKECPSMKFVLVGYSQGAYLIRQALTKFTDESIMRDKIVGLVLFGDPGISVKDSSAKPGQDPSLTPLPPVLYNKLREFCASGDPVCGGGGSNILAHLSYGSYSYAQPAAQFVINAFKGTPLPAKQSGAL